MDAPSPVVAPRSLPQRIGALSPLVWLALAVSLYFAVSLALSWLRSLDLTATTWDLGIYQQAIWSTSHGRPFWESPDAETGSYGSLLQVHSVFVLYLLVPLYAAVPNVLTLYVVQSAVVALAAVPLFLLARDLTGSGRWGLVAAVAYLSWAPVLAANLYDFHAEAFLPLELFAFVLLWSRARYARGLAVAAIAFATIEVTPILIFFVGVFYLLPDRGRWSAGIARLREARALGRFGRYAREEFRRFLGHRRVLASFALLGLCVLAYAFLLLLREQWLSTWFGFPPFPSNPSGYVVGGTPGALGLSWANLSLGLPTKLIAWLVYFALLGFVPLLAPRALVLAIPWAIFTFFSANLNYVTFGFQYGFVAAPALLVAFAYSLVPLQAWFSRRALAASVPAGTFTGPGISASGRWRRPRRSRATVLLVAGLVALVAVNIAASPIDSFLDNIGLGAAYRISISGAEGYTNAQEVAALISPGASVIASDTLFPLVANDVNAYSFLWTADATLRLPFNATDLPSYLFIASASTIAVPTWLNATLYNSSEFGVRAVGWSTPVGPVLLFQRGFAGPPAEFGPAPPSGGTYYGSELDPGAGGYVTTLPATAYASVVVSSPGVAGLVWFGPRSSLAPGNYTVTLHLRTGPANPSQAPAPNQAVLSLRSRAFAEPWYFEHRFPYASLEETNWTTVQFSISEPVIDFEVRGFALSAAATVEVEYISVSRDG